MADRSRAAEPDRGAPSRLSEQGAQGRSGAEGSGGALLSPTCPAGAAPPLPQPGPLSPLPSRSRRGRAGGGQREGSGALRGR